ncbi:Peroxidase [Trema orientale]|uniref:Peroxidase n=1 Tax=Trema orientale TaxID=63057 RepID=A0A2P5ESG5_TREOI|nr:Peroxidase [Trema orientale]
MSLRKDVNKFRQRHKLLTRPSSTSRHNSSGFGPVRFIPLMLSVKNQMLETDNASHLLRYDFYGESCPNAERIVRAAVEDLYQVRSDVAPALLRLIFHDCFIQGCDASVLLDPADGIDSEKESPPNETLRGFDLIDIIKSKLEEECPGVVSCADVLVLAARDSVVLAGGPFYPVYTGRRDSTVAFSNHATDELPSPRDHLSLLLAAFASRGFDERETVSLFGAHSIGVIHCKFFENRLYDFDGSHEPDPSMDLGLLHLLRTKCKNCHSESSPGSQPCPNSSLSPTTVHNSSTEEPGMLMNYDGSAFGTQYYHSLLQGKGILHTDQQLMAAEETANWVRAYAADISLFRHDFALAMMKLSDLQVLTAPMGQIRLNCSKVA